MNKRHEPCDKRTRKKSFKEVHKGEKQESAPLAENPGFAPPSKLLAAAHKRKKISKRTTPSQKIVNSAPSYPHKEGDRWIKATRKQIATTTMSARKKSLKK